jgi:glutathione S-transferase
MSFAEISAIRAESDEEKRKVIRDNIVKEVFPNMLKCLERLTQENNGYLVLGRLTWADLYFVSLSDHLDIIAEYKVLKDYPNLEALKRNVLALSGIKKWVEKRPETSF